VPPWSEQRNTRPGALAAGRRGYVLKRPGWCSSGAGRDLLDNGTLPALPTLEDVLMDDLSSSPINRAGGRGAKPALSRVELTRAYLDRIATRLDPHHASSSSRWTAGRRRAAGRGAGAFRAGRADRRGAWPRAAPTAFPLGTPRISCRIAGACPPLRHPQREYSVGAPPAAWAGSCGPGANHARQAQTDRDSRWALAATIAHSGRTCRTWAAGTSSGGFEQRAGGRAVSGGPWAEGASARTPAAPIRIAQRRAAGLVGLKGPPTAG